MPFAVTISAQASQPGQSVNGSTTTSVTLSNPGFVGEAQTVTASGGTLNLGAVGASPLGVYVQNTDPTNYIQVDANASYNGFPQKVLPGQAILLAPETGTIYAKANTGNVVVFVVAA